MQSGSQGFPGISTISASMVLEDTKARGEVQVAEKHRLLIEML